MLIAGERHDVDFEIGPRSDDDGWSEIAPVPVVERPLRIPRFRVPLLAPFGGRPRPGFRELTEVDPRLSRLWGRFSVDVGVGLERDAKLFGSRVFAGGEHRMFIVEDGDRYAIRGMCAFRVRDDAGVRVGEVTELLHDRSVQGLRGASHVLGLALRAMSDDGAVVARAWSFAHSGSFPILVRHAFIPRKTTRAMRVRADEPEIAAFAGERRNWYVSLLDQ